MNTHQIRGLTLWQPWDVAFVKWGKPLENRSWPLPRHLAGHYVALHRGLHYDLEGAAWLTRNRELLGLAPDTVIPGKQKKPGIVAVARLLGNVTASPSPWFFGPFAWVLEDVTPIEFIEVKGKMGLWNLEPELLEQVRDHYAAAKRLQRNGGGNLNLAEEWSITAQQVGLCAVCQTPMLYVTAKPARLSGWYCVTCDRDKMDPRLHTYLVNRFTQEGILSHG